MSDLCSETGIVDGALLHCERVVGHQGAHFANIKRPVRLSWLDDAQYAEMDREREERDRLRDEEFQNRRRIARVALAGMLLGLLVALTATVLVTR